MRKKIFWLREQAINFARQMAFQDTYFIVLKHFNSASEASDLVKYIIAREKSLKSPYKAKLEYFYVIANHGFSGWHIHLLINRKLDGFAQYCEPVKNLKWSCLYIVKNLMISADADYDGIRRYGASSLLYKQSMKKAFKNRLKRWWLIVQMALVQAIVNALSSWYPPLPYRVDLGYVQITQPQRYNQIFISELTFRKPRDDLIGESDRA